MTEHDLNEEIEDEKYNPVFIIDNKNDIPVYVAGILDISEEEFDKGLEFLSRHNKSFQILFELFTALWEYVCKRGRSGFSLVLEDNYVDRVYRDSYYFYFSGKHSKYSRFCQRIFIFANVFEELLLDVPNDELEEHYAGTIVIRPIQRQSIGRSLLAPQYFIDSGCCYMRLAKYDMTMFGKRLSVRAFPFSMQDGETTTCAEITILNMLDYYSKSYPEYRYMLPSEINAISKNNGYERSLPTAGLKYEMISKAFCEAGFSPKLYTKSMDSNKLRRILYYYVESGIPVALGLKTDNNSKHSVIVIGHEESNVERLGEILYSSSDIGEKGPEVTWYCESSDIVENYCVLDDTKKPYLITTCKSEDKLRLGESEIETLLVPLYKKMYLEAADASEICKMILSSKKMGLVNFPIADGMGTKENPYALRIFMASSRGFRRQRNDQFMEAGNEARAEYNLAVFPKFVWVCEISTVTDYSKKVYGEIVLDATAAPVLSMDSLLIAHYPNRIYCKQPEDTYEIEDVEESESDINAQDSMDLLFKKINNWKPFLPYDSNLERIINLD